jgi:hypothetical protein
MRGAELACKAVTWESSLRLACWLGSTMSSTWLRPEQATRSAATQHAFSGRRTPTRRYTVHCTNQRCHGRPRQTWRGANNGRKRATHADSLARQHGMDCISLAGSIAGRLQSGATALPALRRVQQQNANRAPSNIVIRAKPKRSCGLVSAPVTLRCRHFGADVIRDFQSSGCTAVARVLIEVRYQRCRHRSGTDAQGAWTTLSG